MADEIDSIETRLELKDGMTRKLQRATGSVKSFAQKSNKDLFSLRKAIASTAARFAGLAGALGPVVLAYKAFAAVVGKLNSLDGLNKTADRLGITTEKLQELEFAADKAGVKSNTLHMALQRMVRRLEDAKDGAGPVADALNSIGISAAQLAKLSPDQQLAAIANGMRGLSSQSEKVSLAFKLFDSEGVKMVNMLGEGSEGMTKLMAKARELGVVVSREQVAKIEKANDAMSTFGTTMEGVVAEIAIALAPELEKLANGLVAVAEGFNAASNMRSRFEGLKGADLKAAEEFQEKFGRILNEERLALVKEINTAVDNAKKSGDMDSLKAALEQRSQVITALKMEIAKMPADVFGEDGLMVTKSVQMFNQEIGGTRSLLAASGEEATTFGQILAAVGVNLEGAAKETNKLREETTETGLIVSEITGGYLQLSEIMTQLGQNQRDFRAEQEEVTEQTEKQKANVDSLAGAWEEYLRTTSAQLREQAIQLNFAGAAMDEYRERFTEQALKQQVVNLEKSKIDQAATLQFYAENEKEIVAQKMRDMEIQEQDHQARLQAIWRSGQEAKLAVASNVFGDLSSLMQTENKKLFEIGKRAAQAQALIDTYRGANAAFAETPGPVWVKFAAASAATIAGLVNVANIEKQQFQGGGGGSSPGGANAGAAGTGAGGTEQAENPTGSKGVINISVQGERFGQEQVRGFMDQMGQAISDNYDLRVN